MQNRDGAYRKKMAPTTSEYRDEDQMPRLLEFNSTDEVLKLEHVLSQHELQTGAGANKPLDKPAHSPTRSLSKQFVAQKRHESRPVYMSNPRMPLTIPKCLPKSSIIGLKALARAFERTTALSKLNFEVKPEESAQKTRLECPSASPDAKTKDNPGPMHLRTVVEQQLCETVSFAAANKVETLNLQFDEVPTQKLSASEFINCFIKGAEVENTQKTCEIPPSSDKNCVEIQLDAKSFNHDTKEASTITIFQNIGQDRTMDTASTQTDISHVQKYSKLSRSHAGNWGKNHADLAKIENTPGISSRNQKRLKRLLLSRKSSNTSGYLVNLKGDGSKLHKPPISESHQNHQNDYGNSNRIDTSYKYNNENYKTTDETYKKLGEVSETVMFHKTGKNFGQSYENLEKNSENEKSSENQETNSENQAKQGKNNRSHNKRHIKNIRKHIRKTIKTQKDTKPFTYSERNYNMNAEFEKIYKNNSTSYKQGKVNKNRQKTSRESPNSDSARTNSSNSLISSSNVLETYKNSLKSSEDEEKYSYSNENNRRYSLDDLKVKDQNYNDQKITEDNPKYRRDDQIYREDNQKYFREDQKCSGDKNFKGHDRKHNTNNKKNRKSGNSSNKSTSVTGACYKDVKFKDITKNMLQRKNHTQSESSVETETQYNLKTNTKKFRNTCKHYGRIRKHRNQDYNKIEKQHGDKNDDVMSLNDFESRSCTNSSSAKHLERQATKATFYPIKRKVSYKILRQKNNRKAFQNLAFFRLSSGGTKQTKTSEIYQRLLKERMFQTLGTVKIQKKDHASPCWSSLTGDNPQKPTRKSSKKGWESPKSPKKLVTIYKNRSDDSSSSISTTSVDFITKKTNHFEGDTSVSKHKENPLSYENARIYDEKTNKYDENRYGEHTHKYYKHADNYNENQHKYKTKYIVNPHKYNENTHKCNENMHKYNESSQKYKKNTPNLQKYMERARNSLKTNETYLKKQMACCKATQCIKETQFKDLNDFAANKNKKSIKTGADGKTSNFAYAGQESSNISSQISFSSDVSSTLSVLDDTKRAENFKTNKKTQEIVFENERNIKTSNKNKIRMRDNGNDADLNENIVTGNEIKKRMNEINVKTKDTNMKTIQTNMKTHETRIESNEDNIKTKETNLKTNEAQTNEVTAKKMPKHRNEVTLDFLSEILSEKSHAHFENAQIDNYELIGMCKKVACSAKTENGLMGDVENLKTKLLRYANYIKKCQQLLEPDRKLDTTISVSELRKKLDSTVATVANLAMTRNVAQNENLALKKRVLKFEKDLLKCDCAQCRELLDDIIKLEIKIKKIDTKLK